MVSICMTAKNQSCYTPWAILDMISITHDSVVTYMPPWHSTTRMSNPFASADIYPDPVVVWFTHLTAHA